jgi:septal ring factor EnvC (AmiA/AmiB activator)
MNQIYDIAELEICERYYTEQFGSIEKSQERHKKVETQIGYLQRVNDRLSGQLEARKSDVAKTENRLKELKELMKEVSKEEMGENGSELLIELEHFIEERILTEIEFSNSWLKKESCKIQLIQSYMAFLKEKI